MYPRLVRKDNFSPDTSTIEQFLTELERHGNPRLSKYRTGWNCHLEVFVTGKGVAFEVNSEFRHKTPLESARLCYDRLIKAIDDIEEIKK